MHLPCRWSFRCRSCARRAARGASGGCREVRALRFGSLIAGLLPVLLAGAAARGATLTVNSGADDTTAMDGLVTLREAILAAESDGTTDLGETGSGADTIVFDPSLTAMGDA